MIGILVIAHEPLATALIHCTRHVFGSLPAQVAALDVIPDEDPERATEAARTLGARVNDGSGLLVLTDLYGATPARIATSLHDPLRVAIFSGINLPLLLRAMTHRRGTALEDLCALLEHSAREGEGMGISLPDEPPGTPAEGGPRPVQPPSSSPAEPPPPAPQSSSPQPPQPRSPARPRRARDARAAAAPAPSSGDTHEAR